MQFYSGPGKVYATIPGSATVVGLQPADTNGAITCAVDETTTTRGAAMYGDLLETLDDQVGKISTTPFDNWLLLPYLFPSYLGVTTTAIAGGAAGALTVGIAPHDPLASGAIYGAGVYTYAGRLYNFVRTALTKHPEMTFGAGDKLYGGIEITALGQLGLLPGASEFLMSTSTNPTSGAPITESGAADPDTTGFSNSTPNNFAQSHWTGAWGALSGFVGMEAEDGWKLIPDVKYNMIKVQKITRVVKLASARFMIKARIVGPTHTQLLQYILAHKSGGILTESAPSNLVLTNAAGTRTVTLVNAEPKTAPFEVGGQRLNLGEVGWVQTITVAGGASPVIPSSSLIFSA